jgi:hypothetical protein
MKIFLHYLFVLMFCGMIFCMHTEAQSFILKDANDNNISSNDTIVITGDTSAGMLTGIVKVMNVSNFGRFVFVERISLNVVPGTFSAFAWAWMMYTPMTSVSPYGDSIHPGETDSSFAGWYFPEGIPGTSWYRYCFYNESNHSDSICVVFEYRVNTVAGIEKTNLLPFTVYPNPGKGIFSLPVDLSTNEFNVEVMDALGKSILKEYYPAADGRSILDLSNEPPGIYFLKLFSKSFNKIFRLVKE